MRSVTQTTNTIGTPLQGDLKEGDNDDDGSTAVDEEGRGSMQRSNRQNSIAAQSVTGPPVAMIALLFTPLKDPTPPVVAAPSAAATAVTFLNNVTTNVTNVAANVTNVATNVATNVTTAVIQTTRMRANTNPGSRSNSIDANDGHV